MKDFHDGDLILRVDPRLQNSNLGVGEGLLGLTTGL